MSVFDNEDEIFQRIDLQLITEKLQQKIIEETIKKFTNYENFSEYIRYQERKNGVSFRRDNI